MDTIIMRFNWLLSAKGLTDAQYREYVTKIAMYGFSECTEDVQSEDVVVNALLEVVKPSIRNSVLKYLNSKTN